MDPGAVVDDSPQVAIAVGRLGEEKGFDDLIAAFASVAKRHDEWDLVILGEGPERERLEAQRERLGLAGRVHLPGRAGNVGDWYARTDLFVLSSRFEGFPNTLIEAMAHGLPVVSFDCETGPADIVRDGVDGYLVAPSEGVDGLASAMDRLMGDEDKRGQMGTAGVAVRERLAPERIMAAWDEVLGLNEGGADV